MTYWHKEHRCVHKNDNGRSDGRTVGHSLTWQKKLDSQKSENFSVITDAEFYFTLLYYYFTAPYRTEVKKIVLKLWPIRCVSFSLQLVLMCYGWQGNITFFWMFILRNVLHVSGYFWGTQCVLNSLFLHHVANWHRVFSYEAIQRTAL